MIRRLKPASLAAQAAHARDRETDGVVPGIHPATTFARGTGGGYPKGWSYARDDNPTAEPAENLLMSLEGAAEGFLFGSGMAAAAAVFQSLDPGDHVVAPTVAYFGTLRWLREQGVRWGLEVDFVPMDDLDALRAAVRPGKTRLIWAETPSNPLWTVTDLAGAAEIARSAAARLAVDNTVPTPVITRPFEHGAHVVVHSATKYLGGHSDVVAGAVLCDEPDEFAGRIHDQRAQAGALLGPFEAWLLLRGMRTLYLRVRHASATAFALAARLDKHPKVARVHYPGLESHPGHEVARKQMEPGLFGAMLSFQVKGGRDAALAVERALEVFIPATSLGSVESLVEHRASVEGPQSPTPDDLLRLSVGIEEFDDLWGDLEAALDRV